MSLVVKKERSAYFTERRINMLIIHGTQVSMPDTHAIFSGQAEHQGSAHYVIDMAGNIIQYVDEDKRAWHAGKAYWAGMTDINSDSIGIELVCISPDEWFGPESTDYTAPQMSAFVALVKDIQSRYPQIYPHHILGHQDVTPYRRGDPGVKFDWAALAQQGIGLWHGLAPRADKIITDPQLVAEFKNKLAYYGYDTRPPPEDSDFSKVIVAFQRHFLPWNVSGQVTEQSVQALDILLEKKFS